MRTCKSSRVIAALLITVFIPLRYTNGQTPTTPENPDKVLSRAIEEHRAGNFSEAKSLCRTILDKYPHYIDARNIYARVLSFESHLQESLVQYDSALVYDETNEDARFGKAQVLAWMTKFPESLSILRPLAQGKPQNTVYLTELAKVQFWFNDFSAAYDNFVKAYSLDTTSVEVMRWAARAALTGERKDDAAVWYRRVLREIPHDPEAQFETTRIWYSSENEIQVQYTNESFGPPLDQHHGVLSLEYYHELSKNWKPYARLARVQKFRVTESQVGAGVYGLLSYGNGMFAQLLLSPSATVIPRFDISGELSEVLFSGVEAILGMRFLIFAKTQVLLFSPGALAYVSERAWISGKFYVARTSNGQSSLAFVASGVYRPTENFTIRLTGFGGDESFRATTIDEIVAFQSRGFLLGMKTRLTKNFGIDGFYQSTSRSSQASSNLLGLALLAYF
ncbi:MAG: YaiO family outer membrane beta-barrel protein [Ignavibacteriales bacterium]|nr:YaiO family outer membrane beta-barrel protein [Ignavibacteriales bacterium]